MLTQNAIIIYILIYINITNKWDIKLKYLLNIWLNFLTIKQDMQIHNS